MHLPRLKVVSNGLPDSTLVLLDGKPIDICELHLSVTANDFVRATLVFEASLDLDANVEVGKINAPA
jgi:hypothetical protein